jgi:hypothetical protein
MKAANRYGHARFVLVIILRIPHCMIRQCEFFRYILFLFTPTTGHNACFGYIDMQADERLKEIYSKQRFPSCVLFCSIILY